jgi:PAS domain-containing protein
VLLGAVVLSAAFFWRWNAIRQGALSASFAALSGRVEATGQPYKGIEALVLAGANELTGNPSLTPDCAAILSSIVGALAKPKPPFPTEKLVAPSQLPAGGDYTDQFLTLPQDLNPDGAVPTGDDEPRVFVFVPGISLRDKPPIKRSSVSRHGQAVTGPNDAIAASLAATRAIWREVTLLTGKKLFTLPNSPVVVQGFFLLSTGVLVIHQYGVPEREQYNHYVSQFSSHTFLPERPYFWQAIAARHDRLKSDQKRSDLAIDYVTAPYVDLGTNGPIQTFCWGFVGSDDPDAPNGVLCLDVRPRGIADKIKENLAELGASTRDVRCDLNVSSCTYSDHSPDNDLNQAAMESKRNGHGQLEVFGGIYVFGPPSQGGNEGRGRIAGWLTGSTTAGPLRFDIPLETYMSDSARTLSLLECELNLAGLQVRTNAFLLLALLPLILAAGASLNLASVYATRTRQLHRALDNVHFVMSNASDPYALVDPEDRIVDGNTEFARLLGHQNLAQIKGQDVRSFLQEESVNRYNRQKATRQREQPSEYELVFTNGTKCKVYGAALPVPGEVRRRIPHTFALFRPEVESRG